MDGLHGGRGAGRAVPAAGHGGPAAAIGAFVPERVFTKLLPATRPWRSRSRAWRGSSSPLRMRVGTGGEQPDEKGRGPGGGAGVPALGARDQPRGPGRDLDRVPEPAEDGAGPPGRIAGDGGGDGLALGEIRQGGVAAPAQAHPNRPFDWGREGLRSGPAARLPARGRLPGPGRGSGGDLQHRRTALGPGRLHGFVLAVPPPTGPAGRGVVRVQRGGRVRRRLP